MDHRHRHFTEQANEVLAAARAEADRLRHEYIGTEHLVLALTLRADGVAATALKRLDIDLEGVRHTIDSTVRRGAVAPTPGSILPYTSRTQKVLELARQSARELGRDDVGTEHLLVGVLREGKGIGCQVLVHYGLTAEAAIREIQQLLSSGGTSEH